MTRFRKIKQLNKPLFVKNAFEVSLSQSMCTLELLSSLWCSNFNQKLKHYQKLDGSTLQPNELNAIVSLLLFHGDFLYHFGRHHFCPVLSLFCYEL